MFGSTFLYLPSELTAGQPAGAMRNEVHAIGYVETTFMEDSWGVTFQRMERGRNFKIISYYISFIMAYLRCDNGGPSSMDVCLRSYLETEVNRKSV